jgi:hypothetical protein
VNRQLEPQKSKAFRLSGKVIASVSLVALAVGCSAIFGWWNFSTKNSKSTALISNHSQGKVAITLLGDTFSGYSTFRNPAFQAELAKEQISLTYKDEFDQTKRSQLLTQGQADLLVTTLEQFLIRKPQGRIIGIVDYTKGADAVVLNAKYPTLKILSDLKTLVEKARQQGQQFGITYAADTPSEYLALLLSARFESFNLQDFKIYPTADASEAWALMQDPKRNIAVGIIWEPYVNRARQKGYPVVLSSKDTPEKIIDVIVASDRLIANSSKAVESFITTYYNHIDKSYLDGTKFKQQIAKDGNFSESDAGNVLQGIRFLNAPESLEWMSTQNRSVE